MMRTVRLLATSPDPPRLARILSDPLKVLDPGSSLLNAEMFSILEGEKKRQRESIVLIPSENFTSTVPVFYYRLL
jgi:hypothetical protein